MTHTDTVVISVGGSLIVPSKGDGTPDTAFLKTLRDFVEKNVAKGHRMVLIAGGGKTARLYHKALQEFPHVSDDDLDWIGIHATRLNGQLLKIALKEHTDEYLVTNPNELPKADKPVIVGSGYKPGSSTDLRAIQIAQNLGAKKVVNLSNIDYAYTADPNEDPNAQKIEEMTWDEFLKLVPDSWSPNISAPFDPIASREAKELGMEVAIINGNKLEEVNKYINGEQFIGSMIR
ncbi:MAG: UMP kinase [Candidatus Paceibacteria bacterium]